MKFFRSKERKQSVQPVSWKITSSCLSMILESAKSVYPNEFIGLLRVEQKHPHTIYEIVLLPGTVSGNSHAMLQLHMRPFDLSIVGTIHSHPSGFYYPSSADRQLFQKYGRVHMIVGYPYLEKTWMAYDSWGNQIPMTVI
jgi:proteasome lid subunit RPN8/RPN11